ncbi:unnamed protein product [Heligmosomoides polygyrus]|uniref:Uncharacterized protein n=1 Tax=Heligmosomoides polygyrus TaxID=6339 RepID=A0A183GVB7_HELPZ|nr:unnamed protein product [Heligmosomoides polygyrus]
MVTSTTTGDQTEKFNEDEQRIGRRGGGQAVADMQPRTSSDSRAAKTKVDVEQSELAATARGLRCNDRCRDATHRLSWPSNNRRCSHGQSARS